MTINLKKCVVTDLSTYVQDNMTEIKTATVSASGNITSSNGGLIAYSDIKTMNGDICTKKFPNGMSNKVLRSGTCGLIYGGVLSINEDPTKFNISAGKAYLANNINDDEKSEFIEFTWSTQTAIPATYVATRQRSFIYIKGSDSSIYQSDVGPSTSLMHDYVPIGRIIHLSGSITSAVTSPYTGYTMTTELIYALGNFTIDGFRYTPTSNNMRINMSSGKGWVVGGAYVSDPKCPDIIPYNAVTECLVRHGYQNNLGLQTFYVTSQDIQVTYYFDRTANALATMNNGYFTNRFMIFYPGSGYHVLVYGDKQYSTITLAVDNLSADPTQYDTYLIGGILRAIFVLKKNCSDLSDIAQARIINYKTFAS